MDPPTEAIGFHGTTKEAVPHLLARDIRPSDQHFEWLGTGFYLWQDSPWRARDRPKIGSALTLRSWSPVSISTDVLTC